VEGALVTLKNCELLMTVERDNDLVQILVGTIILQNGKITVRPKPGYESLMKRDMTHEHRVGKRMVSLKNDVVAWFESLPSHYDGERLRARIIDAGN